MRQNYGSAKLIAQENVARQAIAIIEKAVRIQCRVAVKVKQRAAELVCSRSSNRVYLRAAAAVFGACQLGRHLKFADRFYGYRNRRTTFSY